MPCRRELSRNVAKVNSFGIFPCCCAKMLKCMSAGNIQNWWKDRLETSVLLCYRAVSDRVNRRTRQASEVRQSAIIRIPRENRYIRARDPVRPIPEHFHRASGGWVVSCVT